MTRKRWRYVLVAAASIVVAVVVGSCTSAVYTQTLWEAGNNRCGKEVAGAGGWGIEFDGRNDEFLCTVRNARLEIVREKRVPVGEVMGSAGRWPYIPALVAHQLEAIDKDASPLGSAPNFPEAMETAVRRYAVAEDLAGGAPRAERVESVQCSQSRLAFRGEPVSTCRVSYQSSDVFLCAISVGGRVLTEVDDRRMPCPYLGTGPMP